MAPKPAGRDTDRKRLILLIVAAVIVILFISGWMMHHGTVSVRAEKVTRQDIASVVSTNGKVEPLRNFEAHAPLAALVKSVLVKEGDSVRRGQLLLQLDDSNARAQQAHAVAQLRSAEAELKAVQAGGTQEEVLTNRSDLQKAQAEWDDSQRNLTAVQNLAKTGAASPAEVEAAQNRFKKAQADLQLARSRQTGRYSSPEVAKAEAAAEDARAAYAAAQDLLSKSNVRAPFDGEVYQIPVRPGSYVNPGDLLLQMADLKTVQVRAFVDEPEIGRLAKGQRVDVTWDAMPGRHWQGSVTRLPAQIVKYQTRNVGEVVCRVPNPDGRLLPNTNVNVTIITAEHRDVLTVPREAVRMDGKAWVLQVVNGELQQREVRVGISNLTQTEISGVPDNAKVALGSTNGQSLRPGMAVRAAQ